MREYTGVVIPFDEEETSPTTAKAKPQEYTGEVLPLQPQPYEGDVLPLDEIQSAGQPAAEPNPEPTMWDKAKTAGKQLAAGALDVIGGIGQATEQYGRAMSQPFAQVPGEIIRDVAAKGTKYIESTIPEEDKPRRIFATEGLEDWTINPELRAQDVVLGAIRQIPQFAPGMGAASKLAKASPFVRRITQGLIGAIQSGGMNAASAYQQAMETPQEILDASPEYLELTRTLGPDQARKALAQSIADQVALTTAPVGAAAGALEMGGQYRGGALARMAKGAAVSGATEVPTEVAEQVLQNVAGARADERIEPTMGVKEAGAMAAIVGAAPGAIAARLTGPIRDMYDADLNRGMSPEDAMDRVSRTSAGKSQIRQVMGQIEQEQRKQIEWDQRGEPVGGPVDFELKGEPYEGQEPDRPTTRAIEGTQRVQIPYEVAPEPRRVVEEPGSIVEAPREAVENPNEIIPGHVSRAIETGREVPDSVIVKTKAENKKNIIDHIQAGEIDPENTVVRMTDHKELGAILDRGGLTEGRDFEGRAGISAQDVSGGKPVMGYGDGISVGIVIPKGRVIGRGVQPNEVKIDPRTPLAELRFTIDGLKGVYTAEQVRAEMSAQTEETQEKVIGPAAGPAKTNTILSWLKSKGGVNINNEHWKGELRQLRETLNGGRRFGPGNAAINTASKHTLDQLAIMAKDEGFISDATPDALLDAIAGRKVRPEVTEAGIEREMARQEATTPAADAGIIFNDRGSAYIPSPADLRQAVQSGKDAYQSILDYGKDAFSKGKDTYFKWIQHMRDTLGDLWAKVKDQVYKAWNEVKAWNKGMGERGSIGFSDTPGNEGKMRPTEKTQQVPFDQAEKTFFEEMGQPSERPHLGKRLPRGNKALRKMVFDHIRATTPLSERGRLMRAFVADFNPKRVAKVRETIEEIVQEVEKKGIKEELLEAYTSKVVHVDWKKKVREIGRLHEANDTAMTKALREKMAGLYDFIDKAEQPHLAEYYKGVLDRIKSIPDGPMKSADLKAYREVLKKLTNLGRLKRMTTLKYDKEENAYVMNDVLKSTRNLDKNEGEHRLVGLRSALKEYYLDSVPGMIATDVIDGTKDFNGENTKILRKFGEAADQINNKILEVKGELLDRLKEAGLKEDTEDLGLRLTLNKLKREKADAALANLMKAKDVKEVPQLTAKEEKILSIVKEIMNRERFKIAAIHEETTNTPFTFLDDYHWPLKYEGQYQPDPEYAVVSDMARTVKTADGFVHERNAKVTKTPRTDWLQIVMEAIDDQQHYVGMKPHLENWRTIFKTKEFRNHAGDIVYNWWSNRLDSIARRGWSAEALSTFTAGKWTDRALRKAASNITEAGLSYRLSSVAVQPMSALNAASYAQSRWGLGAAKDVILEAGKAWIMPGRAKELIAASDALKARGGAGEVSVVDAINDLAKKKSYWAKFKQFGLKGLTWTDLRTAAGTQAGFKKIAEKYGSKNAQADADFLMNLTQGSTNVAYRPQVFAKNAFQRLLYTFQSFGLAQWGLLTQGIIKNGFTHGGKRAFQTALALAMVAATQLAEDEAREGSKKLMTGRSNQDDSPLWQRVGMNALSILPLIGGTFKLNFRAKGSMEPPLMKTGEDIMNGIQDMVKALFTDKGSFARGALKAVKAIGAIAAGVPTQLADIVDKRLLDLKGQRSDLLKRTVAGQATSADVSEFNASVKGSDVQPITRISIKAARRAALKKARK